MDLNNSLYYTGRWVRWRRLAHKPISRSELDNPKCQVAGNVRCSLPHASNHSRHIFKFREWIRMFLVPGDTGAWSVGVEYGDHSIGHGTRQSRWVYLWH